MARPGGRPLFDCSRPSRLADRPPDEPPGAVALSTPVVCPSPGEAHAGIGITCRHDLAAFGASCCIEMRPDLGRVARVVAKAGGSSRGSHRHTGSPKNPEYSFNSPRTRSPPHSASSSASSLEAVSAHVRQPGQQPRAVRQQHHHHDQYRYGHWRQDRSGRRSHRHCRRVRGRHGHRDGGRGFDRGLPGAEEMTQHSLQGQHTKVQNAKNPRTQDKGGDDQTPANIRFN